MAWVEYELDEIAHYAGFNAWEVEAIRKKLDHIADWNYRAEVANTVGQMLSDLDHHTNTVWKRAKIWLLRFKKRKPTAQELELHRLKCAAFREILCDKPFRRGPQ